MYNYATVSIYIDENGKKCYFAIIQFELPHPRALHIFFQLFP